MSGVLHGVLASLKAAAAAATDSFFKYVTLLLHGDGTNGAQNNTFLDGSTNNFTITRNGNTTQGTFSPFSQTGWSNYFDGTGDYLSAAANTAFDFGTGDYTIECWVNLSAAANFGGVITKGPAGSITSAVWSIEFNSTATALSFFVGDVSAPAGSYIITTTTNVRTANAWTHVAVTRSGNNTRMFINGVQEGSTYTLSYNIAAGSAVYVGSGFFAPSTNTVTGYISNARIVKGTAVYTANFTPPTSPLTAITNTSLLTCQSNRFIDNSSNAFAITRNGDVRVEAFSPFNPSTTYSTSVVGGSGYFDGTGDYLTVPDNSAFVFDADLTIEAWVYVTSLAGIRGIVAQWPGDTAPNCAFIFRIETSGVLTFVYGIGASNVQVSGTTQTVKINEWNHVAVTRSGTTVRFFVNGNLDASTYTVSGALNDSNGVVSVGVAIVSSTQPMLGYISSLRLLKGTAQYTAAFTPPTAPLTAITNTSLLCNFTNGGIFDNASQTVLETVGNAQVSTTQKKFGTGSMYFDGTGDWLIAPDRPPLRFGTADFTVEGWVYLSATGAARGLISKGTATTGWAVDITSGNKLQLSYTSSVLTGTTSLAASTWYHFAVIRYGSNPGNVQVFLNGVLEVLAGTAITTDFNQTNVLYVGANRTGGDAMNGYIDDLRITNGYSRYGFFTPPSTALTPTAYTAALPNTSTTNGAQNNTFLDGSTNNFTITRNGNTTQGTFSPFSNSGWSNYFDGTGDYLTFGSSTNLALGSGDYTVECWLYLSSYNASTSSLLDWRTGGGITASIPSLSLSASGQILWYESVPTVLITSSTVIPLNTWSHVALARSGTSVTMYLNGTSVGTATSSASLGIQTFRINDSQGSFGQAGYISNVRIVKGTAVYTSNFTPPTAPLTAITNTSLLTCQSNRFIDNSTNAFAITRNGDVSVQAFSPFTPAAYSSSTNGGSGYFDGTGDYLTAPDNAAFDFGSGDFTIEAWVYPTTSPAADPFIWGKRAASGNYAPILFGLKKNGTNFNIAFWGSLNGSTWGINGAFAGGTITISQNTWTHIAVVRSGTTITGYVNGVADLTVTSISGALMTNTSATALGASDTSGSNPFPGYISNLRALKGTAQYTANFTPPTSPLTAITNTSLLLNFTNAGIYDAVGINNYETVGNAQASTTQAKFGTTSMYFDGTGDWLTAIDCPPQRVGSGNFTIEGWFYLGAVGTARGLVSKGTATTGWSVNVTSGNKLQFSHTSSNLTGNATLVASTWYHFAVVRSGTGANNVSLYLNGVLDTVSTSAITTDFNQTNILYIGANRTGGDAMNGYIDDVRITPGQALYNTNFTPPTAAFPDN